MDYTKKYKELISGFTKKTEDISTQYPECSDFEKCIIALRKLAWTYGDIQKILGMPSKKLIRSVLLKWAPELIDNSPKKVIAISELESDLYNILIHTKQTEFESDSDYVKLWIEDHTIWFQDETGYSNKFHNLDEISQKQYMMLVKISLNKNG